jgi:hypothetical protein
MTPNLKSAPPGLRKLSRRLLEQQAGNPSHPQDLLAASEPVCQKLQEKLVTLIGSNGCRVLISRAWVLTRREFRELNSIETKGSCHFQRQGSMQGLDPDQTVEGQVVMLANLLWLLMIFIGEDLSMHLMYELWPDLPPGEVDSSAEEAE